MSTPAKITVLRAILANDASTRTALTLGIRGKTDTKEVTLTSGQLTTEVIVRRIKELSKLRDEILQVMRQLNLTREGSPSLVDKMSHDDELESARRELDEARSQYQEVQGTIEKVQRQIDDSRERIATLSEISQSGFGANQLESDAGDFRRVLGRLPVKKLESALKAVQSQFKDQVILAVGNKKQDTLYILVAAPKDRFSQALQTLLLYNYTPIETPHYKLLDVKSELQKEEDGVKVLAKEVDELKLQLDDFSKRAGLTLNRRLDQVIDALMLLRAILKLGEGTQVSQIYAHLERVPPPETLNNLSRRGIIELESSS